MDMQRAARWDVDGRWCALVACVAQWHPSRTVRWVMRWLRPPVGDSWGHLETQCTGKEGETPAAPEWRGRAGRQVRACRHALETARLTIRPWSHDEAERLLDIQSRIEVVKWLGDGEPVLMKDLDEAHVRIDRYLERSETPPLGFWAVEVRETGVVAGSVILLTLPNADDGEVEVGWHLHPDSWGHGYATEAATAVIQHGFDGGLPEVYALTHTTNEPSQAVCRASVSTTSASWRSGTRRSRGSTARPPSAGPTALGCRPAGGALSRRRAPAVDGPRRARRGG